MALPDASSIPTLQPNVDLHERFHFYRDCDRASAVKNIVGQSKSLCKRLELRPAQHVATDWAIFHAAYCNAKASADSAS